LERGQSSATALAQAEQFDWKHSAAALLQLYKEAMASPKLLVVT